MHTPSQRIFKRSPELLGTFWNVRQRIAAAANQLLMSRDSGKSWYRIYSYWYFTFPNTESIMSCVMTIEAAPTWL
jgi:hypothetical protein